MVEIEKKDQLIVKFFDRLDATNATLVAEKISPDLDALNQSVVLDVSKLEYISSAGLQVILKCAKAAKAADQDIFLTGAKEGVMEIFRISGFLTFLKLKE